MALAPLPQRTPIRAAATAVHVALAAIFPLVRAAGRHAGIAAEVVVDAVGVITLFTGRGVQDAVTALGKRAIRIAVRALPARIAGLTRGVVDHAIAALGGRAVSVASSRSAG